MVSAPPRTTCPACGADVTSRFCQDCGQSMRVHVRSMRALLRDVLDDQLNVNATLPRTLRALFFRPGLLTLEYLRDRISPYVPPFRLYLAASVLFFLALALQPRTFQMTPDDRMALDSLSAVVQDTVAARAARGEPAPVRIGVSIDPSLGDWAENVQVNLGSERLNSAVRARLVQLGELPPEEALRRLVRGAVENTPKVMFLLLPFHALLLALLHLRSRRFYVEHFVFSLHVHAFTFMVALLMLLGQPVPLLSGLLLLWLLAYQWLALKRVYGHGWVLTTAKWAVLGIAYSIAVGFGLALAFLAAVFTA